MKSNKTIIGAVVVGVLVVGLSFFGGMLTQKALNRNSSSVAAAGGGTGGYGGGFGGSGGGGYGHGGGGVFGTVQSISGTTMTVSNQRTGGTSTVSLASSPTVTDAGSSSSVSAIQTGDTVIVRGTAASNGTVTAQSVILNPSFGGGGGGAAASGGTASGA
jgi:hypothetical protein